MSQYERDTSKHEDPQGERQPEASTSGPGSDADDAAAVIANLVRRTTERDARPGPSSVAHREVTVPQPPMPVPEATQHFAQPAAQPVEQPATQQFALPAAQPVEQPATQQFALPAAQPVEQPATQPVTPGVAQPGTPPVRVAKRLPSTRILVAGGAVAAVLIAGVFALSRPDSSHAGQTSPAPPISAPAVYTVKATDVITDCAGHSHGRTKSSFKKDNCVKATRFLATGHVSGRPAVFVMSRIQMPSAKAAASLKHVLDATGTGNLNDLLREGKTFPGAPNTMPDSGYASVQTGSVVVVAETGFVHGASSSTNPALRAVAAKAAALVTAQN